MVFDGALYVFTTSGFWGGGDEFIKAPQGVDHMSRLLKTEWAGLRLAGKFVRMRNVLS
jgi:hypothetical protein